MKQEESFFVNLFRRKIKQEVESTEVKLNNDHDVNLKILTENEWKQEYEVIYESYALELN
jgi:hypothetical protein